MTLLRGVVGTIVGDSCSSCNETGRVALGETDSEGVCLRGVTLGGAVFCLTTGTELDEAFE